MKKLIFLLFMLVLHANCDKKFNKYSKEANVREEKYDPDFRKIEKPFRMAKTNLVWTKAVNVSDFFLDGIKFYINYSYYF